MITKEQVIEALKQVEDPEIHLDIWTLELIRDIAIEGNKVIVTMIFTSPMCPYGPLIIDTVKARVEEIDTVKEVEVIIKLHPPWNPSAELRAVLGV